VDELKAWRKSSLYSTDDDYLFPSIVNNGETPIMPDMLLKRHIRPVLEQLGITKKTG